jgi:hypothetical protein
LATRFAEIVHADGGAVLYGRADADALLPYQPFAEALAHLVAHAGAGFAADNARDLSVLGRMFPGLAPDDAAGATGPDGETLRYQAFEAVVAVLARAADRWPVLLVLDDLHWADTPTLKLLRHVLRHVDGARLLVLGTFRDVEIPAGNKEILADLRRDRRFDELGLGGLDTEATRSLVADQLARGVTPGFVERLQAETDGNAFFIEETLRALLDAGLLEEAIVDEDALGRLGVPEQVSEVIHRRVLQLPPLAIQVLTAASVIGREFHLWTVESLVDADAEAVLSALEAGLGAHLIVEVADQHGVFAFAHALVLQVLYTELGSTRRIRLHHRVAQALEGRRADGSAVNPATLAHHYWIARQLAPDAAYHCLMAAGKRATELFAYEEAVHHYRHALELVSSGEESLRFEVLLCLGRVQWHAGDDEARHSLRAAADSAEKRLLGPDSAERRRAADQLARAALALGERYFEVTYFDVEDYRRLLDRALDAVGPADSRLRALLLARLAVNLAFPVENERAHALAVEAEHVASRLDDEKTLAAVLLARHVTLLDVRFAHERLEISARLEHLTAGHPELEAERHQWRMYDLLGIGDFEGAHKEYEDLEKLAAELGQPLFRSLALGSRGLWAELDGEVELAERCAAESFEEAKRAHTRDALSSWASQVFALRRRDGRLSELTSDVERLAGSRGHVIGWRSGLGVLRFETGDVDEARAIYEQELAGGVDALPHGMFWLTRMALLSELSAKLGDVEGAEQLYRQLERHAARHVVVAYCSYWGPVEGYLGLLAETFGDPKAAANHFDAARKSLAAVKAPLVERDLTERWGLTPGLARR